VTAFRSRFTVLRISRDRGDRASPLHLGERNCTSTGPKLSKTSSVHVPHPWRMRHFEGTDRSFAMYVAFPHADYYAQSDCPQGFGRFGAGLPCLLSTVLCIPCRLFHVHRVGLRQNGLGGVLLNAPSPLWGSPVFLQGRVRLTWSPMRSHPMEEAWVPRCSKSTLQARQADITSKVCQGPLFPKGYARFR
jgi:hypothetical protein